MTRFLMTTLLTGLLTTTATAETCTLANDFCVPFVGCIEDGRGFFHGYSFGRKKGPLTAFTENGATCEGRWWRNAIGVGKAEFSCENGLSGRASYTYFEPSSGTAFGKGRTNKGDRVRFWAGHRLLPHVLSDQKETDDILACVTKASERAGARR